MKLHFAPIAIFLAFAATAAALPAPTGVAFLAKRQYKLGNIPYFPQEIPSCVGESLFSLLRCNRAKAIIENSVRAGVDEYLELRPRGGGFQGAFGRARPT